MTGSFNPHARPLQTAHAISAARFATEGWLKTSVPSTVLAAQVKAGVVPDPYFGRQSAQDSRHDLSHRPELRQPAHARRQPLRLRLVVSQGVQRARSRRKRQSPLAPLRRHQLSRRNLDQRAQIADSSTVAGAYRTYDFDVTEFVTPGKANVLAVKTTAPTEKDLGINWVDWNPCPPDKDMGLWGAVDLVETGPVTVRSPMAVTHFRDAR